MSLLLTLEHGPRGQAVRETRLDQGELVIGRSAEADWQIDDPDMYISRAHCTVSNRGDGYFITDTSSSGLFIDDSSAPLGAGNSARLRNGMRLRLGDYIVGVEVRGEAGPIQTPDSAQPARPSASAPSFGHDDFFSVKTAEVSAPPRPSGLPDPFEKQRPSSFGSYERSDADRHKSPAFDDPFSMDAVATPTPTNRSDPKPTEGPDDPFGFYSAGPAREPPAPVVPPPPAPTPPPDVPVKLAGARPARAPWELPAEEDVAVAPRDEFAPGRRVAMQAPAGPEAAPVELRPVPRTPVEPRMPRASDLSLEGDEAYQAFLRGLGVEAAAGGADPAAEMEKFGREYRLMLEGLMQLLRKRAEEKGNARVAQTVVGASEVNPLKFMPTVEDALSIMMRGQSPGFLAGEAAIADSVRDLASHHVRAWRGVQGALRRMVDRFDPAALEEELKSSSGLGTLLSGGKSAKLWELYQKRHREIAQSAETRFLGEIGADFRDAYEEE